MVLIGFMRQNYSMHDSSSFVFGGYGTAGPTDELTHLMLRVNVSQSAAASMMMGAFMLKKEKKKKKKEKQNTVLCINKCGLK